MKLVVNSLLGLGMQAIAEAMAFGQKAGIDRSMLLDVLAKTSVVAPAHAYKLERAKNGDYSPQFPIRHMNKDFRLIVDGREIPASAFALEAASPAPEGARVLLRHPKLTVEAIYSRTVLGEFRVHPDSITQRFRAEMAAEAAAVRARYVSDDVATRLVARPVARAVARVSYSVGRRLPG